MPGRLPLLLLLPAALLLGLTRPVEQPATPLEGQEGPVHLLPFGLLESVRDASRRVPMQIQVYHAGEELAALESFEARAVDGRLLAQVDLGGESLRGDGGDLFQLHFLLERLDPGLSHRHEQRLFIPLEEWRPLPPEEEARLIDEVRLRLNALRESGVHQLRNLRFEVDLAELFPAGARPGDEAVYDLALHYRDASGVRHTARLDGQRIRLLDPWLPPPDAWFAAHGRSRGTGGSWLTGDLHVHNCRDQAILGCPDCPAESFNVTGSFTNADLAAQFQALGFDFFSTTTHSYCINSDAEFNDVLNESQILDTPDFQVICGTELTTEEQGPQMGTDVFDTVCFLGGQFFSEGIAHYGGHGITSRKEGGQDGFLDNCDPPIRNQQANVDEVNAEGGFAIANHPGGGGIWGGGLGLNSVAQFEGIEGNRAWGSEIWNGGENQATTQHRAWWIGRLTEGKFTYPYSGSDTHDAAFDFGATHVWHEGALTDASLIAALKSGNHYLSNGPFLSLDMFDARGNRLEMGGIAQVPANRLPANYPVTVEVFYNTAASSTVTIFVGSVGAGETAVATFPGVSGQGSLQTSVTVPTGGSSWYRAELIRDDGSQSAYTSTCFVFLF